VFLSRGIALDTWVVASRDCEISCEVVGDQAQFVLGHAAGSLNLVLDQGGLANLVEIAVKTWTQWQTVPEGKMASFTVTASELIGSIKSTSS
jgi:hypothetical protein